MLAALLALAHAADLQPGLLAPGAVPVDAGTVSVAAGGGMYDLLFGGTGPVATTHISWAPTDRLQLSADGAAVPFSYDLQVGAAGLTARYLATDGGLRLAPYAGVGVIESGAYSTVGLAMEGGWKHVRLDASLSTLTFGVHWGNLWMGPAYAGLGASEAGMSFLIGGRDQIRVGLAALPNLRWRHTEDRWYVELMAGSAVIWSMAHGRVGVRF